MKELGLADTMPFGKHQGEQIEDLLYDDPTYLTWLFDGEMVSFDCEVIKKMGDFKLI